jgi:alkanesulfonate monooxygenase SsuD/methylene tetrahydromethanopterin reductase-like flavin-dependent oxidoreductase (luciferase family)
MPKWNQFPIDGWPEEILMKFHLIQPGMVGRREDIERGMAGQRLDLFQRYLEEIRDYVALADDLGFAGYGHTEHHLQLEGFEASNHPGMMSLFIGTHSKRLTVGTLGYVLPTHNPLRAAEEIATLDHMLKGRLLVGFVRGYQARWVDSYAALRGVQSTSGELVKARDERDMMNREVFAESLRIVKTAWTNSTFSHKGKYWQFPPEGGTDGHPAYAKYGAGVGLDGRVEEVGIAPLCYQQPHPRVYGAFAHSMQTVKLWADEGGKLILLANSLDFCESLMEKYISVAAEKGREVAKEDVAAWGGALLLGRDKTHAQELYDQFRWLWDTWLPGFDQKIPNLIMGDANDVRDQIAGAQERLGINEVWLWFGQGILDPATNSDMLSRFATDVMPHFSTRDHVGMYV